jgi:hypothetical protein
LKKKNIVFIAYDEIRAEFFGGLIKKLRDHKSEPTVRCFVQHLSGKNLDYIERDAFLNLEKGAFGPIAMNEIDTIILFNGRAVGTAHSTQILRKMFPEAQMLFMEQGWFPQRGNVYLAEKTVGADAIPLKAQQSLRADEIKRMILDLPFYKKIKELENPFPGKKYIFFPMQIENDTSIIYDSPYYKDNLSAYHNLETLAQKTGSELLWSPHPKDSNLSRYDHLLEKASNETREVLERLHSDPWGSYAAMLHAEVVAGINSTLLIEALAFDKKVFALGQNIVSSAGCYFLGLPHDHEKTMDEHHKNKMQNASIALAMLMRCQFDKNNPTDIIVDSIVNGDF